MHPPERQEPPAHRARAGIDIETVLRTGSVRMLFQPIVTLDTGRVVAFEALIRARRPVGSQSADKLLAAATRSGALPALDRLAHAIALASAPYLCADAQLFINAAPASIIHPAFTARTARLAALAGIPAERVVIEITEIGTPADAEHLAAGVEALRSLGFGIAIDDVGAGQGDLARILKLRPGWIKLDRALVQDLITDAYSRSLVAALVRFASHNAIRVVAEGIELPSQARAAADLGVTLGQGFWFAHPLPLPDARSTRCPERVLRRWRGASLAA